MKKVKETRPSQPKPTQFEAFTSFDYNINIVDRKLYVFEPTITAELSANEAKLSSKSSRLNPLPQFKSST